MKQRKTRLLFLIPTRAGGGAERVVGSLLQHLERGRSFGPGSIDGTTAASTA